MTPKLRGILQVKTTQCVLLVPHKFQSNGSTINRSRITGHFKEITLISSKMAMSSASNSKSWVKKIATTQGVAFEDVFSEKLHVHQNGQIKGVLNWQPRVGILIQPSVGPLTLGSDPLLVTNDLEIFTYRPLAEWLSQKKKKKRHWTLNHEIVSLNPAIRLAFGTTLSPVQDLCSVLFQIAQP